MTATTPPAGTLPGSAPVLDEAAVLARLPRPRPPTETTVAVVADPHVATRARNTWKRFGDTERKLLRAVETIRSLDVDAVAVLGDLTKDGEPRNFDRYDELLEPLSAPVVTVPGNHDVPKADDDHEVLPFAAFRDRYAPDGYPVCRRVGGVDLVGLNSATDGGGLADTWAGRVSERQLEALDGLLADAATPVVLLHHNLYELPHNPGGEWKNFPLRNGDRLREVLAAHGVDLVLSGHQHVVGTHCREGVRELLVPAVCSYPQALVVLRMTPEGTTVRIHPLGTTAETARAYEQAVSGSALGRGVAVRAGLGLESLPLVDALGDGE